MMTQGFRAAGVSSYESRYPIPDLNPPLFGPLGSVVVLPVLMSLREIDGLLYVPMLCTFDITSAPSHIRNLSS